MLLALCTWVFLGIVFVYLTPMERAQTSVVVVVATCAEIIGSVIWGIYVYRLGPPLFVPPGHGFVYLTGLRISQTGWAPDMAGRWWRSRWPGWACGPCWGWWPWAG